MRIVSFSEASNNMITILDQVSADADYTVIRRRGSEDAVIMSWGTFSVYLET